MRNFEFEVVQEFAPDYTNLVVGPKQVGFVERAAARECMSERKTERER